MMLKVVDLISGFQPTLGEKSRTLEDTELLTQRLLTRNTVFFVAT